MGHEKLVARFFISRGLKFFNMTIHGILRLTVCNAVSPVTAPMFLSGMIFTFCTCPVVSNIWRRMSSVTLGSSPPTYNARLFGSGAARRTKLPEPEEGDSIPVESPPGDVMAVGMGFVFCGITTGGSGGGGMCAGLV